PSGLVDAGASWQDLGGPYTVSGTTLTVRLRNAPDGYVIADAIRIERLPGPPPAVQILDDASSNFAAAGPGVPYGGQGYQGQVDVGLPGAGTGTATWTFSVAAGVYRVSATWLAYVNRSAAAPFTVLDGSTALGTVALDQRQAPSGLVDAGASWQD